MNKLTIIGNLTADPQSNTTNGDKVVCNFTVAVNRRKKIEGQPEADFFRVAAWGKLGENCQKYLAKGRKVGVVGPVSVRTYEAKDGTTKACLDLYAEDVEFLSSRNESNSDTGNETSGTPVTTDDLPF